MPVLACLSKLLLKLDSLFKYWGNKSPSQPHMETYMGFILFLNNSKEVLKISSPKFRDHTSPKLCMTVHLSTHKQFCPSVCPFVELTCSASKTVQKQGMSKFQTKTFLKSVIAVSSEVLIPTKLLGVTLIQVIQLPL